MTVTIASEGLRWLWMSWGVSKAYYLSKRIVSVSCSHPSLWWMLEDNPIYWGVNLNSEGSESWERERLCRSDTKHWHWAALIWQYQTDAISHKAKWPIKIEINVLSLEFFCNMKNTMSYYQNYVHTLFFGFESNKCSWRFCHQDTSSLYHTILSTSHNKSL